MSDQQPKAGTAMVAVPSSKYERDVFQVTQTDHVRAFIPDGYTSIYKFAELIAESGMAPKGLETPDKCAVAIFHGMEVGMTPMSALQSIAVVNGRATIWGDGALAIIRASGQLEDIEEFFEGGDIWSTPPQYDLTPQTKSDNDKGSARIRVPGVPNPDFTAVCRITRKGAKRPVEQRFSVADAMAAGLWTKEGPWRNYPKRMLKMRARSWLIRDEFTDVMRGLILREEAEDFDGPTVEHVQDTEAPKPPANIVQSAPAAETVTAAVQQPEKRGRGRPKKNAAASEPEGPDRENATDAEVIEGVAKAAAAQSDQDREQPLEQRIEGEQPASEEAPKPPAEQQQKPAETKPTQAAQSALDDSHRKMMSELIEAAGTNKELRAHYLKIDEELMKCATMEELRDPWGRRNPPKGMLPKEMVDEKRILQWHKDRVLKVVEEAQAEEEAPKPPAGAQFDYDAFVKEVDRRLTAESTPDRVNVVFDDLTRMLLAEKVLSDEQIEDLNGVRASHLERVDFD